MRNCWTDNPYERACRFATLGHMTTSPLLRESEYDKTFGVYVFLRSERLSFCARRSPTMTSETSQEGSTSLVIRINTERGREVCRVKFFMAKPPRSPDNARCGLCRESPAILLLAAPAFASVLARRGVNFAELNKLIVGVAAVF